MTTPTMEQSVERVLSERSSVQDEQAAFERFRETVRETPIETTSRSDQMTPKASVERLRSCYRDTVMETAGDEILESSLEAEFSSGLALKMQQADVLTGRLKCRLLDAINTALARRSAFLVVLKGEQRSIESVEEALLEVNQQLE